MTKKPDLCMSKMSTYMPRITKMAGKYLVHGKDYERAGVFKSFGCALKDNVTTCVAEIHRF